MLQLHMMWRAVLEIVVVRFELIQVNAVGPIGVQQAVRNIQLHAQRITLLVILVSQAFMQVLLVAHCQSQSLLVTPLSVTTDRSQAQNYYVSCGSSKLVEQSLGALCMRVNRYSDFAVTVFIECLELRLLQWV